MQKDKEVDKYFEACCVVLQINFPLHWTHRFLRFYNSKKDCFAAILCNAGESLGEGNQKKNPY